MTDKKLDTGTGGINIDGKVYTYDVGVEREVGDDGPWSGGDVKVDTQARDVSKGTRRTLAQYLSDTTLGKTDSVPQQAGSKGNRFVIPMQPDGNPGTLFTTVDGNPVGPQPTPSSAFEPNLSDPNRDARPNLPIANLSEEKVSRGMIRSTLKNDDADNATANQAAGIDGNNLLKFDLESNIVLRRGLTLAYEGKKIKDDHPVATYSSSLIKNRWNTSNRFGSTPTEDTLRNRPLAAIKYELGASYSPERYLTDPNLKTVSHAQLAGVANTLMARASTELTATDENFDPANAGFQTAASLLPGFGQLGAARVSELVLQAKDVLENMDLTETDGDEKSPGIDAANITSIAPGITSALTFDAPLQSWGALNNPFDVYTGLGALGMQILSIAFVIAITIIPSALNINLDAKPPGGELDEYSRMPIGRYKQTGKPIPNLSAGYLISGLATGSISWATILGFGETSFPLSRCIAIGILAFFGLYKPILGKTPEETQVSVKQSLLGALTLSGTEAYVIFSRSIIRSFLLLVDEIIKIGRAFANPTAGIQQLLGFIEFFRSSKIMRFLNTCGLLGDQMLLIDLRNTDEKSKGFGPRSSSVDAKSITGDSAYRKSRLIELGSAASENGNAGISGVKGSADSAGGSAKNLRHAWSSFRSPDMLILPKNLLAVSLVDQELGAPRLLPNIEEDERVGTRNGSSTSLKLRGGVYSVADTNERISSDDRKYFEGVLDAEYMPFYFHDVRTNEIVSFHAFLASLGDSYTAGYDSTDAFGRVEPVKTYKNTVRKIDVSFHIAAMSPEDFDYMWLKINKLTTLVYPQFTPGKLATTPNYSVSIPFSQQIAAAPLVRLRIGDLIQSNYSRFNLARLFGYTYGSDEYTDESGRPKGAKGADLGTIKVPENFRELIASAKTTGNTFTSHGELNFTSFEKPDSCLRTFSGTPKYLRLKINKVDGVKAECTVEVNQDILEKIKEPARSSVKTSVEKSYGSPDDPRSSIIGKKCIVHLDDLIPTDETYKKVFDKQPDLQKVANYQAAVQNFMRPEVNSVVRSFESSGGRGMPGFIETMSFDWYSGVTWEEDSNRGRAPKMCKVTMSFSPFHDITPGLDSRGANRAPIYPIGPHAPKKRV